MITHRKHGARCVAKIAPLDINAFTGISVAPSESVAFSFTVPNLSIESFTLPLSVSYVSLLSMQFAKHGATSDRTATVGTQSGTLVAQLIFALP